MRENSLLAQIQRVLDMGGPVKAMRADEAARGYRVVLPGDESWLSNEDWPDHVTVSTDGRVVRIVAVIARHPGTGAFSRLVHRIIAAGMTPVVVCPFPQMQEIVTRWGWSPNEHDEWMPPTLESSQ